MTDNAPAASVSAAAEAAGRPEHHLDGPQRVVVGLDGSAASGRALVFAAREAQVRHGVLHLVSAYDVSSMSYGYAVGMNLGFDASAWEDGLRAAAEARLKEAADTVAALVPGATEHLKTTAVEGRASQVLLEAARGATMLVVGSRGVGALTRLMLGSTSTEVVHHAHLPVTVVPADQGVDQDADRGPDANMFVGLNVPSTA